MTYQEFVKGLVKPLGDQERLVHAAMGVSGEAGELLDAIKKHWVYGKELDVGNVMEELGDILFYVQAMANEFGWDLTDLVVENMKKLQQRYPSGAYSDAQAIARADKVSEE